MAVPFTAPETQPSRVSDWEAVSRPRSLPPTLCWEPLEGEDHGIFVPQFPAQGWHSVAFRKHLTPLTPALSSPILGHSVLLDSCLVSEAGEDPSGVDRTVTQRASCQVGITRPGTGSL